MRSLFYIVCSVLVVGLAYWAYKENYKTKAALTQVKELQQQIAQEQETIAVLNAEWAYLNRPDRLRDLVELNFPDLKLIPLLPSHFGDSEMVAYPTAVMQGLTDPVTVSSKSPVKTGAQP
ncbi:MAG: cell division protein FtsL [Rhodobacterales bacterium]